MPDSSKNCNIQNQIANRNLPAHQRHPYEHGTQSLAQGSQSEGEKMTLNLPTSPYCIEQSSVWQGDHLISPGLGSLSPSLSPRDLKRKRSSFERGTLQVMRSPSLGYETSTICVHQSPLQDAAEDSLDPHEQINCLAYYYWTGQV